MSCKIKLGIPDFSENSLYKTHFAIIDGQEVAYDLCDKENICHAKWENEYLGEGIIYKINGVVQEGSDTYHFWRKV